ncbi:WD repeat protein [Aspergillus luchuensis]|uniref:WD repeat protein n=1 Tax=Aspergillus kawachii TaxID=1069201 RepID=A0A146FGR0_ASPKA|nr:WD repeat protein [Aspergillus luchuensis]
MSLRMGDMARCMSLHNGCADSALRMSNYKAGRVHPDGMVGHSCASKPRIPGRMGFGNGYDQCDMPARQGAVTQMKAVHCTIIFKAAYLDNVAAAIHSAGNAFSAPHLCEIANLPALHGIR